MIWFSVFAVHPCVPMIWFSVFAVHPCVPPLFLDIILDPKIHPRGWVYYVACQTVRRSLLKGLPGRSIPRLNSHSKSVKFGGSKVNFVSVRRDNHLLYKTTQSALEEKAYYATIARTQLALEEIT